MKEILSFVAVVLTFTGYVPYIRSILAKRTKPHIYSWFIWTLDSFIIFGLQFTHGAGTGSFVAFSAGLCAGTVFLLSLRDKHKQDITKSDKVFFVLALVALVLWLFAKEPILSTVLIMAVDVLGFFPTVRKTWYKPHSEELAFYVINFLRFVDRKSVV